VKPTEYYVLRRSYPHCKPSYLRSRYGKGCDDFHVPQLMSGQKEALRFSTRSKAMLHLGWVLETYPKQYETYRHLRVTRVTTAAARPVCHACKRPMPKLPASLMKGDTQ
jgi:hypothetical protein